jgi:hypothetical protein
MNGSHCYCNRISSYPFALRGLHPDKSKNPLVGSFESLDIDRSRPKKKHGPTLGVAITDEQRLEASKVQSKVQRKAGLASNYLRSHPWTSFLWSTSVQSLKFDASRATMNHFDTFKKGSAALLTNFLKACYWYNKLMA